MDVGDCVGLWDAALSFFQNLFFPIHRFVRHKKGEKESLLAENSVRVRRSHMWDLKPLLTPDLLFLYAETQFPVQGWEKIQFQCLPQLQSIQSTTPKDDV